MKITTMQFEKKMEKNKVAKWGKQPFFKLHWPPLIVITLGHENYNSRMITITDEKIAKK